MSGEFDPHRALRALRALYVVMRYPFDDEVTRSVEGFGRQLAAAIDDGDWRRARAVCDQAIEWARKMRHPIARRLELALGAE
jgi:hypothetical protein